MKKVLSAFTGFTALALTGLLIPLHSQNTFAQADHIIISEIQIKGATSADEFVELYNPLESNIDITNWTLHRKTASGTEEILVATANGTIPAHGFYLFANSGFDGGITADISYTENISDNNSIILRDKNGKLIDLVGLGTSLTYEVSVIANPIDNRSVERKANSSSTQESMVTGGIDEFLGNGEDTNNNALDFIRKTSPNISEPQNSSSSPEPAISTPTPTTEPSPSLTPSPSPEPTSTPTPLPTQEPTPTQTLEPTPTVSPTITPIPTTEPSPTLTPSATPTPTKGPKIFARNPLMTCKMNYRSYNIFGRSFYFPLISCYRNR